MTVQEYFVFLHCCAGNGIPAASTSDQVSIVLKQCSSMNLQNRAVLRVKELVHYCNHVNPHQNFTNWKKKQVLHGDCKIQQDTQIVCNYTSLQILRISLRTSNALLICAHFCLSTAPSISVGGMSSCVSTGTRSQVRGDN